MEMTFTAKSVTDLQSIASELLKNCTKAKKFLVEGSMGAGKTTLISTIMQEMEVKDDVSSPTYSIVNEYFSVPYGVIFHFDFYRIEDEMEAVDIGVEEMLDSPDYCFIEWAERIPNLLPDNYVKISIQVQNEERHIKVKQ